MVFISKVNNYVFRPKAAIFRLSQLQFCSKSVIKSYSELQQQRKSTRYKTKSQCFNHTHSLVNTVTPWLTSDPARIITWSVRIITWSVRIINWSVRIITWSILNESITMCLKINKYYTNVRQHNLFILE